MESHGHLSCSHEQTYRSFLVHLRTWECSIHNLLRGMIGLGLGSYERSTVLPFTLFIIQSGKSLKPFTMFTVHSVGWFRLSFMQRQTHQCFCAQLVFPASRGLSRRGKMKREERDLCRLPTSFLSRSLSFHLVWS